LRITKVEGRIGSDRGFETKLRELEEVITSGKKRKISN
jgi:hypothetical protein